MFVGEYFHSDRYRDALKIWIVKACRRRYENKSTEREFTFIQIVLRNIATVSYAYVCIII